MTCVDAKPYIRCLRQSVLNLLLATSVLGISACSDSDDPGTAADTATAPLGPTVNPNDAVPAPSPDSIADSLLMRMDFQTLLRLVEESDLVEALQGDNSGMGWTLFAPSDIAFENAGIDDFTPEQLDALVRNHLHSGQLSTAELMAGELQMTVGSVEVVRNQDGSITVGGATIIAGDRVQSNGVFHFVNSVLEPL